MIDAVHRPPLSLCRVGPQTSASPVTSAQWQCLSSLSSSVRLSRFVFVSRFHTSSCLFTLRFQILSLSSQSVCLGQSLVLSFVPSFPFFLFFYLPLWISDSLCRFPQPVCLSVSGRLTAVLTHFCLILPLPPFCISIRRCLRLPVPAAPR